MPGAVPRTSTFALTNATLPYVRALADLGWEAAFRQDDGLAAGLNVHAGKITHPAVASALGLN
jgi:alanine dehydrogenase